MSQHPRAKLRNDGWDFTPTIHNDTYDFISPTQFDLAGRAVFITGGSKGCGKHAALSFARAGATFIGVGARSQMDEVVGEVLQAAQDSGHPKPTVIAVELDVCDKDSIDKAANAIKTSFGRLDILVNNAGHLHPFSSIHESDPDVWWRSWEVSSKGSYLVSRAFLPLILSCEGLRTILNVTSIGAVNLYPGTSGYACSKLAQVRFSEFLSLEYAAQGLLSFAVHPGAVPTELSSSMPETYRHLFNDTPALAADTMVWLTAARREWLAGRYISATWDMEELVGKSGKIEEDDLLKIRMDVGLD